MNARLLYINQNGRITCYQHGGVYLQTAIRARKFGRSGYDNEVITPLDSWIAVPPHEQVADSEPWECEECVANAERKGA